MTKMNRIIKFRAKSRADGKWYDGEWQGGKWYGGEWVKGRIRGTEYTINPMELAQQGEEAQEQAIVVQNNQTVSKQNNEEKQDNVQQ